MKIRGSRQLVTPASEQNSEFPQATQSNVITYDFREPSPPKISENATCPRCNTQLTIAYNEPECLQCGYADYSYVPPVNKRKEKSLLSAGTRYVLRYVGDFPYLNETLAHVKLKRLRNRVVFGVTCPFCEQEMEQSSLSGKRREVREERYRCEDGHRVSLTPAKGGSLGWK